MRITITELKWKENERERKSRPAGPSIVVVSLDKNPPRNGVVQDSLSFGITQIKREKHTRPPPNPKKRKRNYT